MCPHWLAGGVGLAASMHLLAAAGTAASFVEVDANPNPLREDVFPLDVARRRVRRCRDAPGLGVEPDLARARALRTRIDWRSDPMQYMLLILEPHGQRATRTDAEGREAYDSMLRYADELKSRGVLSAAQSLRTDTDGVRVNVRDGKRTLVDGPFSEIEGDGRRLLPRRLREPRRGRRDREHASRPPSGRPSRCASSGPASCSGAAPVHRLQGVSARADDLLQPVTMVNASRAGYVAEL